ncbi:FkbM family methyltransferase [Caulobacter sp. 17J65-9]|uniref:FkbM family methyltransferase n=1 Tax=Caulobacter sp. 17J65-9 TaxID=2709382 RepID=UPI0013CCCCA0|nr:FkbM family methyltransferase [Caulobacter sp. 17J65-9]NEX94217.1 FkbM family methyltransferase [Caulobacter sp. 17J65-9]
MSDPNPKAAGVSTQARLAELRQAHALYGAVSPDHLLEPVWALLGPVALTDDPPASTGALLAAADALAQAVIRDRPGTRSAALAGEMRMHIDYLAQRVGVAREGMHAHDLSLAEPLVLSDALNNIGHLAAALTPPLGDEPGADRAAPAAPSAGGDAGRVQYIGRERLMVRLPFGYLVVPAWNLDVGLGVARDGVIEPWTTAVVRTLLRPGQTYVNVGANFGYYTVLGASLVGRTGRVVSVEANPHLVSDLIRSIYASGYPDIVRVHQCAVSDAGGLTVRLTFDPQFIGGGSVLRGDDRCEGTIEDCFWDGDKIARMKREHHEVVPWHGFYAEAEVVTETLDVLLSDIEAVDVLQMDIEGCEPAAIIGAEQVLRRSPGLSIIMEWSPNFAALPENRERVRRMWALLGDEGFRVYAIVPGAKGSETFPDCTPIPDLDALLKAGHGDLVCLKPAAAAAQGLA